MGNLSGGEFQRVLIARAISKKPELLVLDEPVQGVDYTGEIALYELIKKISDTLNCGILLISHDLHTVMTATDHVVCLNGHVCCSGTPMDVAKNNEYKTLFGEQASQILTVYEHKHDHVYVHKLKEFEKHVRQIMFYIHYFLQHQLVNQNSKHVHLNKQHDL